MSIEALELKLEETRRRLNVELAIRMGRSYRSPAWRGRAERLDQEIAELQRQVAALRLAIADAAWVQMAG